MWKKHFPIFLIVHLPGQRYQWTPSGNVLQKFLEFVDALLLLRARPQKNVAEHTKPQILQRSEKPQGSLFLHCNWNVWFADWVAWFVLNKQQASYIAHFFGASCSIT